MQRQSEAAAKAANKPKRGQKGAQTSGGSKTKGDTVGGAKPISKSTSKPAAKPTTKTKVADYNDAQGNTYDGNTGRLKSKVAAKPAAKPAPTPSSGGRTYASSSTRTTTASATEKPKSSSRNIGPVASGDEYARNKDPKKYNPLMQKTFDYQTGDSPKQRAQRDDLERARSDANKAQIKQGPPVPAQPAKPASPPSPNQPKKNDKGTKVMTLAERIRRRRLGLD
jgi:hypothetical protein